MNVLDLEPQYQLEAERHRTQAAPAYAAAGLGQPPARNFGENMVGYRVRLADGLKHHSSDYSKLSTRDMLALHRAGALGIAEKQIYADAVRGAQNSSGPLREIIERDQSGRAIHRFVGSETEAWAPFRFPTMIGRINVRAGR